MRGRTGCRRGSPPHPPPGRGYPAPPPPGPAGCRGCRKPPRSAWAIPRTARCREALAVPSSGSGCTPARWPGTPRRSVPAQGHGLLAVHEHRRAGRFPEPGRLMPRFGMLGFAGAVDDATHDRHLHGFHPRVPAFPDRHLSRRNAWIRRPAPGTRSVVAPAARAGHHHGRELAEAHGLQDLLGDHHLPGAAPPGSGVNEPGWCRRCPPGAARPGPRWRRRCPCCPCRPRSGPGAGDSRQRRASSR